MKKSSGLKLRNYSTAYKKNKDRKKSNAKYTRVALVMIGTYSDSDRITNLSGLVSKITNIGDFLEKIQF